MPVPIRRSAAVVEPVLGRAGGDARLERGDMRRRGGLGRRQDGAIALDHLAAEIGQLRAAATGAAALA